MALDRLLALEIAGKDQSLLRYLALFEYNFEKTNSFKNSQVLSPEDAELVWMIEMRMQVCKPIDFGLYTFRKTILANTIEPIKDKHSLLAGF